MRKMYLHIKHNENGPTFKMPVSADDFAKDAQPVNEAEILTDEEKEEWEQHDDYYNRIHAFDDVNHLPETYK